MTGLENVINLTVLDKALKGFVFTMCNYSIVQLSLVCINNHFSRYVSNIVCSRPFIA